MKGKTIKLGLSGDQLNYLKQNGIVIFFIALLITGYLGGIIFASKDGSFIHNIADIFFDEFINIRLHGGYINILISSLILSCVLLFMNFISGLSLIGMFFVSLSTLFKGMLYGIIAGMMVNTYSFKGLLFYICIILFPALISSVSLVFSGRRSIEFSGLLLSGVCRNGSVSIKDLKIYCLRHAVIFGFTFISAVADMLLSCFFGRLFGL